METSTNTPEVQAEAIFFYKIGTRRGQSSSSEKRAKLVLFGAASRFFSKKKPLTLVRSRELVASPQLNFLNPEKEVWERTDLRYYHKITGCQRLLGISTASVKET